MSLGRSPPPLPPLNALRAFEAAARHLSFTKAAAELCVTQTAISHQVRTLETHLGTRLFQRGPQLSLTDDGLAWSVELSAVFARLAEANRRLARRVRRERPLVSLTVVPSFGARWLVPRLGRFLAREPGVDVQVSPNERLIDFAHEPFDVGIRYGTGGYDGLQVDKLGDGALFCVCAPSLLSRHRLTTPSDLAGHVLLHDDAHDAWPTWLDTHHARGVNPSRGPVLTDTSMLVEAAVQGQGVALARWSIAMDDLAAGRLVRPFPRLPPLMTGLSYYLVRPAHRAKEPHVSAFCSWLLAEASVLRQWPTTPTAGGDESSAAKVPIRPSSTVRRGRSR